MSTDTTHLHALESHLHNERQRLREETAPAKQRLREVWIRQLEREVRDERKFLGLLEEESAPSDDELLAELLN